MHSLGEMLLRKMKRALQRQNLTVYLTMKILMRNKKPICKSKLNKIATNSPRKQWLNKEEVVCLR
jgi:hypothetical protein